MIRPGDEAPGVDEAMTQRVLEQQLEDLALFDPGALDVLMRLGQAVFPDTSAIADSSLLVWPEHDRSTGSRHQRAADPAAIAVQAERAETRFKSLISQIPAVVFFAALGEGENEVFVSPQIEELLGFNAEEWLGDPLLWYRQLHPDDHDRLIAAFTKGVQTGEPFRAEVRFFSRDGKEVWILGEARLIKDDLGRPDFFQGVAFDISTSKEAQIAAEQAAIARETFLATMTHELRTPLNSVIVLSGLLAEGNLAPEYAEMVRTMQASADFLLKLIADILDFSRLRAAGLELDVRPFDLHAWLRRTVEIASPAIGEKSLALSTGIADFVPQYVFGDEGRLRQVLLNLLTNATKFTKRGRIDVRLSADNFEDDEWMLRCSVDDSGSGVAPELADALFDEFRQADAGIARQHGGAGLGLAICKQLCVLMGGDIWVEESPLGGARFVFTWRSTIATAAEAEDAPPPAASLPSIAVPPVAPSEPEPVGDSALRILVAEDNSVNTFVIKRVLSSLGYAAEFVVDGVEAVNAVTAASFDVVLMDISMPNMDGLTACREIRKLGADIHQPVIMGLTAHAMPGDRAEGIAAGMDEYLTKPIDKHELARALAQVSRSS